MWSIAFLVYGLTFDLTLASDQCWCTDSDLIILPAPAHSASSVDVLASGSCLNISQFEQHGPWIKIKSTEKSGFVHYPNGIQLKDCARELCGSNNVSIRTDSHLAKRHCSYQCIQCCTNAQHGNHHHDVCNSCDSHCCDQNNGGGHTAVWSVFSACSVTCGEGTQSRHCADHCNHNHVQHETRTCVEQACPPPVWSAYGPCSVTCGDGTRTRHCTDNCDGTSPQTEQCHEHKCHTVVWSDWSACSKSCGGGDMRKQCTHHCPHHGVHVIHATCNTDPCPIVWSEWSACSKSCGGGDMVKHCTYHCPHRDHHVIHSTCNTDPCPTVWSDWSACSKSCGGGDMTQQCTQHCPHHGHVIHSTCNTNPCPAVHQCDRFGTIQALAELNITSRVHCADRWNSGTENFVQTHCHGIPTNISTWHQGDRIITDCQGPKTISTYTPIGTFMHNSYHQDHSGHQGISGIFIACTPTGFKMATKACEGGAEIIDVPHNNSFHFATDAVMSNNPHNYYTIKW